MNNKQLDNKISEDMAYVQKDVNLLVGDSATRLGRLEEDLTDAADKAKGDLATWVEDGTATVTKKYDQMARSAKRSVNGAVKNVKGAVTEAKKDVNVGLRQYNGQMQEYADRLPNDMGKQITKYPWVTMSVVLVIGFLLGILIKPGREHIEQI